MGVKFENEDMSEFQIRFIITKLYMFDEDAEECGFADLLLVINFHSNHIEINNIQSKDGSENVKIGRVLTLKITPEELSKKLKSKPLEMTLIRRSNDLGTVECSMASCLADVVLSNDFTSEKLMCEYDFIKDCCINAQMQMVIQISKSDAPSTSCSRKNDKSTSKGTTTTSYPDNILNSSSGSEMSFTCDGDLLTDLCPIEEESERQTSSNHGSSSKSKRSSLKSSPKCCSDIATSLDISIFSDEVKTFCVGCGGYSLSGVTCENKDFMPNLEMIRTPSDCMSPKISSSPVRVSPRKSIAKECKHPLPVRRICSKCFEDLSQLPAKSACPKCLQKSELPRKAVCLKNNKRCRNEEKMLSDYVQNIARDIFLGEKKELLNDWKRLKGKKSSEKVGKKKTKRREKKNFPRCRKLLKAHQKAKKPSGLRVKHPGIILGHKTCKCEPMLVPKNMGWLWNIEVSGISKLRRGWRPGAIAKTVADIMKYFLNLNQDPCLTKEPNVIEEKSNSTLRVKKKCGDYTITLNPYQDDGDKPPVVFKITKSDEGKKRHEAKLILRNRGIHKKCNCDTLDECTCFTENEKQHICCELKEISDTLCLHPQMKFNELNETSESELDFEFTPPYAMKNKFKRPVKVSYACTQYEQQEISEHYCEEETCAINKSGTGKDSCVRPAGKLAKKGGKNSGKIEACERGVGKNKRESGKANNDCRGPKRSEPVILKDLPQRPKCCNYCNSIPNENEVHCRVTTNYNPLYRQTQFPQMTCPPRRNICCYNPPMHYHC